jgi:hypothetical protein
MNYFYKAVSLIRGEDSNAVIPLFFPKLQALNQIAGPIARGRHHRHKSGCHEINLYYRG